LSVYLYVYTDDWRLGSGSGRFITGARVILLIYIINDSTVRAKPHE